MTSEAPAVTALDFTPSRPTNRPAEAPSRKTARIAGVFYLLVAIFGGFAEGYVEPTIYAAGNATAHDVIAKAGLVCLGVVADLLDQAFFVAVALTLYALLKSVNQNAARVMAVLVVVAAAIGSLNAVFLFEALQMATNPGSLAAFGADGVDALVRLQLETQHYGLLAAQLFFGLWLAPLGYLAIKSGQFPRALGVLLIAAAGCYLLDLLAAFLLPDLSNTLHGYIVIPCAIAEIWMVLYLLVIGVRSPRPAVGH